MAVAVTMSDPTPSDSKRLGEYIGWPKARQKANYKFLADMYNVYMINL